MNKTQPTPRQWRTWNELNHWYAMLTLAQWAVKSRSEDARDTIHHGGLCKLSETSGGRYGVSNRATRRAKELDIHVIGWYWHWQRVPGRGGPWSKRIAFIEEMIRQCEQELNSAVTS